MGRGDTPQEEIGPESRRPIEVTLMLDDAGQESYAGMSDVGSLNSMERGTPALANPIVFCKSTRLSLRELIRSQASWRLTDAPSAENR